MRLMCAAAVSLSIGLFLAFADDKKPADAKTDRTEKLKELQKKFDGEMDDLRKRFNNSKDDTERRGIRDEAKELAVLTSQKAIKIAEEDPKDATGFSAALFVVEKTAGFGGGKEFETAIGIISEHHLANPKVKDMLPRLASAGPAGQKLLKVAAEKAADKEVKGMALFFLGVAAAEELDDEEDARKQDELVARATEYFVKAAREAPDVKIGETTISKEASSQLESLQAVKNLAVGKPVPDVEGTDLGGKKIKLSSYKGKVLLVDVWATWCGPCRAMIPHEREMVKKLKDKPFALLSVSCDNQQDTLTKFFEKEPMPWDHWFDGKSGNVAKSFRVKAFPTLYLIDHAGVIRHKWIGSPGDEKITKAVEDLVKEAQKAKG